MSTRLTPEVRALRTMTEAAWQRTVEGIATANGWLIFHAPANRPVIAKSGARYVQNIRAGFPDLVAVRGKRLLFAELKREGPQGVVSQAQADWMTALGETAAEVYLWTPSDLPTVREVLR